MMNPFADAPLRAVALSIAGLGIASCTEQIPPAGDLGGCYELTWTSDGVQQTGPLIPRSITLDTSPTPSMKGSGEKEYAISAFETPADTAPPPVSPFPVLNWKEVYSDRGWAPVTADSITLHFGDGAGLNWEIGLARRGGEWNGGAVYVSRTADTMVSRVIARRTSCDD